MVRIITTYIDTVINILIKAFTRIRRLDLKIEVEKPDKIDA